MIIEPGRQYEEVSFRGHALGDDNLVKCRFIYCDFTGCDLSKCHFRGTEFWSCDLDDVNFGNAIVTKRGDTDFVVD